MPHFQLVTAAGDVLGLRELGGPDWPVGSVIQTGPNTPKLRVVRVLERDGECDFHPDWFQILVVEDA